MCVFSNSSFLALALFFFHTFTIHPPAICPLQLTNHPGQRVAGPSFFPRRVVHPRLAAEVNAFVDRTKHTLPFPFFLLLLLFSRREPHAPSLFYADRHGFFVMRGFKNPPSQRPVGRFDDLPELMCSIFLFSWVTDGDVAGSLRAAS